MAQDALDLAHGPIPFPSKKDHSARKMIDRLIEKFSKPINGEETQMIALAKEFAKTKCADGKHHTICVAKGKSGRMYYSIHLNCARGREFSACAEIGVLQQAAWDNDQIVKLVVAHHKPGRSSLTIVPPCAACIERLRRFASQRATAIIRHKRGYIKFPVRRFLMFAYPIGYKNVLKKSL
jgi:cytidine deaminase